MNITMILKLLLPAVFAMASGCSKDKDEPKSAEQLLTRRAWKLVSLGLDENYNNMIDPSEESIRECDLDNIYHFFPNGTGVWEDKGVTCGTGVTESPFTWKLVNNNTAIDFLNGVAKIYKLTEDELWIYFEIEVVNNEPLKVFTIYRH